MKKITFLIIIICVFLMNASCSYFLPQAATPTVKPVITTAPEITNIPESPQETATIEPTQAPVDTPTAEATPYNTMEFYSCYADMVSYDPATGWAEFDYFYILKGQDAIDYLVDHEGYTQQAAEDEVNNYADGEYVCQNDNPGLRTIDLDKVQIKLMFHADGTQVSDSISIPATSADVTSLYNLDPKYLFDYFFFFIHCDTNGNVILVEQIYWC